MASVQALDKEAEVCLVPAVWDVGVGDVPIAAMAEGYAQVSALSGARRQVQDYWQVNNGSVVLVYGLPRWFPSEALEASLDKGVTATAKRRLVAGYK